MKKIIITGNAGRDAESRADQTGNMFTSFSVAVNTGTKSNPKTDWVDVSCGGKLGEIALMYVKKGTKVLVEGYPTANAYLSKEGKPIATLRVFANSIELLSKKDDEQNTDYSANPSNSANDHGYETLPTMNTSGAGVLNSDDIPF